MIYIAVMANFHKMYMELQFLFAAHCLMMLYICTRFGENMMNSFTISIAITTKIHS